MSTKETLDSVFRLLEILISWPVIFLCVVLLVRRELPALIAKLAERVTKAPGGFEFTALQQKVETLGAKVERLENVTFEPSVALTPQLQIALQSSIDAYHDYLTDLGFQSQTESVRVFIDPKLRNIVYDRNSNRLIIGKSLAKDTDGVFREYTHYALTAKTDLSDDDSTPEQLGLLSGLADYFACSFNNDPLFGERSVHLFLTRPEDKDKLALRNLKNDRTFDEVSDDSQIHNVGEIWGGAFWELRERLEKKIADRLLFSTWDALNLFANKKDFGVAFVRALLKTDQSLYDGKHGPDIQATFTRRGLVMKGDGAES